MKPKVIVRGSEMAAEQTLARELRLESMRAEAEARSTEAEIESKERIERLKVAGFLEDERREREIKERIRTMKIEAARREAEEAVSPIKEGLAQITARMCEAAQEMSERLQDTKFVPGSLAKRARQMCEWYSLMNFTGDDSLENVLTKLQEAAGREAKQRSPEEMRNALNDILRATTVQSRKLLDEDRLSALEL
jgi:chemotaxis regulatin CheY-phosphate phosphatase CheZ